MDQVVAIRCKSAMSLPLESLQPFQGNLKTLTDENYQKLKKEIVNTGFSFAVHCWQNPSDQAWYIVDGHQRASTLTRMRQEGFVVPAIPIVPVEATTFAEAKRRVLQGTSQYGHMTEDGLKEFIIDSKFDIDDLAISFDFAGVDLPTFVTDHFRVSDFSPGKEEEQGRLDKKAPVTCPKCGEIFVPES